MPELPKPAGIVHGVATVGIPAIAGITGAVMGDDLFALSAIIKQWMSDDFEASLPLSSRLNYQAALTEIPYGVLLTVEEILSNVVPGDGKWWHVLIFRSARWFLIGIMVHLLLTFVGVAPIGRVGVPAVIR